jgi:cytochrome P450
MLAFGAGPRTCLGRDISLMEMYKVIPQIVRHFDSEILAEGRPGGGYGWETLWFTKQTFNWFVRERHGA